MSAEMPVEAVHVAISVMLIIVISMSLCMIIQYASRYHKYQRASMNDDLTDTDYSGKRAAVYYRIHSLVFYATHFRPI